MKLHKIWIFMAVAIGFGTVAWSQPTLSGAVDVVEGSLSNPEDDVMAFHWDVTNETQDTLVLMASRYIVQIVQPFNLPYVEDAEGAHERFCWGPICYPMGSMHSNTSDGLLVTLLPGATDTTFVGDYYPNGVAGVSAFEYCFYPPGQEELSACHTTLLCVDAETCALSTADLDLGPEWGWSFASENPADELMAVSYTLFPGVEATFELFDLSGTRVQSTSLRGGQGLIWLDTGGLSNGIYLGSMQQEGQIMTSKLVVSH